jgi:hypothetical protein
VYHMMKGVQKFCPIYTLCVGNAFGEAALLLSAGSPVSSTGGGAGLHLPHARPYDGKGPGRWVAKSVIPEACQDIHNS